MNRKIGVLRVAVLLGTLCSAGALNAQFVDPTTVIEIGDGNTPANGTSPNCDWDTLNGSSNLNHTTPANPCGGASATINAYTFLVGGLDEKNFTTGGSKDGHDIGDWRWTQTSTPDKDTLTHAYAISYTAGGHKILAFGGERHAVNGDANIGVWFFQQGVGPAGSGSKDGFGPGVHSFGDIFAVSAFTNGGGHPGLDVYRWNPACNASHYGGTITPTYDGGTPNGKPKQSCGDTNLELIYSGAANSNNLCSNDPGCTAVNGTPITTAWPYDAKFGGAGAVPVNGFFEGGFDLSAIFPGGSQGCFSSFLMETRSSQSTDAVLKDFLAGSFPECKIVVQKSCACTAFDANGGPYSYRMGGTIENQGGPVFGAQVQDQGSTFSCGNMAANTTKTWGFVPGGGTADCTGPSPTFTDVAFPTTNQATASAHTDSNTGSTTNLIFAQTDVISCNTEATTNACTPVPGLTLNKTCVTTLEERAGLVVVRVDYVGEVTNNGNVNVNSVSVEDKVGGVSTQSFNVGSLTVGQSKCYTNSGATTTCPALSVPSVNLVTPTFAANYNPTTLSTTGVGIGVNPGRA